MYDVEENTRTLIGSSDPAMVNTNRHVSLLNTSGECKLLIKDYATIHHNKTKIYTCCLSRRTSKEEKNLTVQYSNKIKGQCQCKGFYHNERKMIVKWVKDTDNLIINSAKNEWGWGKHYICKHGHSVTNRIAKLLTCQNS